MSGAPRPRIILVGAGRFTEEITDIALMAGVEVAGWIEGLDASRARIDPLPPIVWVDEQRAFEPGSPHRPRHRRRCAAGDRRAPRGEDRRLATLVHPSAVIAPSAKLEPGCVVFPNVVIGARTRGGAGTIINRGALVGHHTEIGAYSFIGPGANVAGAIGIGEQALREHGAVVRDGRTVGARAVIGAGAVADVAAEATVVGSPARPLTPR